MAKYTKTIHVASPELVPIGTQPGQWVKVGKEKKSRRLVSATSFGRILVEAPKGGRVSTACLRLARDKGKSIVLGVYR